MAFLNIILNLFRPLTTVSRRYSINGKEVSEAEWYVNGGLEAEEALDEAMAEMDLIFKRKL
jgi:hypothetical protein